MKILENIPIATLTTMRLGGPARYVIEVTAPEEIPEAFEFATEKNLPVWIMGGGANTIGHDEGFNGVIILNRLHGIEILGEDKTQEMLLRGMGGEVWDDFVQFSAEQNYSGIEAMAAIPGTLGAAPVQNIGAYGQEIAEVLDSVEVYDAKEKKFKTLKPSDLQMGYRKSIFNQPENKGRYFIVAVTVRLKKGQLKPPFYTSLQRYVDEHQETDFSPKNIARMVTAVRKAKLPDPKQEASSGSFFKNVYLSDAEAAEAQAKGIEVWQKGATKNEENDASEDGDGSKADEEKSENVINSGWLIENAGLKGKTFHGMRVSDKAALVLINDSAKSYADLAKARAEIRKIVHDKYGYELAQEPVEIE